MYYRWKVARWRSMAHQSTPDKATTFHMERCQVAWGTWIGTRLWLHVLLPITPGYR